METLGQAVSWTLISTLWLSISKIGHNYKQAIQQSGVKRVVHLSSIGAHSDKGNGILAFHYNVENILRAIAG
jgi:uncharacterized protein YbjT (DUF2867 family)